MATISDRTGIIASSPDSAEAVATTDENADGRRDQRDDPTAAKRLDADQTKADQTKADQTAAAQRAAAAADATVAEPVVPRGPRPRASLTATISLILGVIAALSVLTGVLAGPGVGVGLLAACAGLAGIAATSRRHVAGKSDAFLGIALGLASIVFGVLAITGKLSWLDPDTNQVTRLHDWLASNVSWLLP